MSTRRAGWCHIRAIRAFTFEDKKWLLSCLEDNIGQIRGGFCPKIHSCGRDRLFLGLARNEIAGVIQDDRGAVHALRIFKHFGKRLAGALQGTAVGTESLEGALAHGGGFGGVR